MLTSRPNYGRFMHFYVKTLIGSFFKFQFFLNPLPRGPTHMRAEIHDKRVLMVSITLNEAFKRTIERQQAAAATNFLDNTQKWYCWLTDGFVIAIDYV